MNSWPQWTSTTGTLGATDQSLPVWWAQDSNALSISGRSVWIQLITWSAALEAMAVLNPDSSVTSNQVAIGKAIEQSVALKTSLEFKFSALEFLRRPDWESYITAGVKSHTTRTREWRGWSSDLNMFEFRDFNQSGVKTTVIPFNKICLLLDDANLTLKPAIYFYTAIQDASEYRLEVDVTLQTLTRWETSFNGESSIELFPANFFQNIQFELPRMFALCDTTGIKGPTVGAFAFDDITALSEHLDEALLVLQYYIDNIARHLKIKEKVKIRSSAQILK
jgi:hypothetical protein